MRNIFILIAALLSPVCIAQTTELEANSLIRVIETLENVKELAESAEDNENPNARVKFDYEQFNRDVEKWQAAIKRHVSAPNRSPRNVIKEDIK